MAVKSHFSEAQIGLMLDNKHEYTEHVCDHLSDILVKVFQEIYEKAYKSPLGKNKGVLEAFQQECEQVISWNAELVSQLYKKIKNPSFAKLLKMVFMTHIKAILAQHSLRLEGRLHVRIPGAEHFVHKCAIEMARSLWKRPYLYYHKVRSLERQRNLHECDLIARKAIRIVIRQSIPMEQILHEIEMAGVTDSEQDADIESFSSASDVETEESSDEVIDNEVKQEPIAEFKSVSPSMVEAEAEAEAEAEVEADADTSSGSDSIPDLESDSEIEQISAEPAPVENKDSTDDSEGHIDDSNLSTQEKSDEDVIHGNSEVEMTPSQSLLNLQLHESEPIILNNKGVSSSESEDSNLDEEHKSVEWTPPVLTRKNSADESIEVEKNSEIPPIKLETSTQSTEVNHKTTLMGTRHLINPKRIKFVGSGKKDSFF